MRRLSIQEMNGCVGGLTKMKVIIPKPISKEKLLAAVLIGTGG